MATRKNKPHNVEVVRSQVAAKRSAMGIRFARRLNLAEGEAFLSAGRIPADALLAASFSAVKAVAALPAGARCLCCGVDLSGKSGAVVEFGGGKAFGAICAADIAAISSLSPAAANPVAEKAAQAEVAVENAAGSAGSAGSAGPEAAAGVAATAERADPIAAANAAQSWVATASPEAEQTVERFTAFLSEFSYFRGGVSMRLVNSFARAGDKTAFLKSYCEVSQMEDLLDLVEKMKSEEFALLSADIGKMSPATAINRRFALFYGAPGGGKTCAAVAAAKAANGGAAEIIPCSPSMDAAETLYAYRLDYETGRRGYVPTALLDAMTNGKAVVLDEINLMPMEARMFLQNILDNKSEVSVMGRTIPIREGFFVFGTMNLETGLGASPLPLPLVDRAAVIREFKPTVAQTAVGAGLC